MGGAHAPRLLRLMGGAAAGGRLLRMVGFIQPSSGESCSTIALFKHCWDKFTQNKRNGVCPGKKKCGQWCVVFRQNEGGDGKARVNTTQNLICSSLLLLFLGRIHPCEGHSLWGPKMLQAQQSPWWQKAWTSRIV